MFLTTLAALTLAASSTVSPVNARAMHKQPDTRVHLTLRNDSNMFRDVTIEGHMYEILSHQSLEIKAPAGTVILAASRTPQFHNGDVMLAITPEMNKQTVEVR